MRALVIGVGQCGNKIVDVMFQRRGIYTRGRDYLEPLLINTAEADLRGAKHVPDKYKLLIGRFVVRGHGVGGDNTLAAKIALNEADIMLNKIREYGASQFDAFMLVGALGGGTGSGVMPILRKMLRETYEAIPVITVGVLPARFEGDLTAINAGKSLMALIENADSMVLVDNEKFVKYGEDLTEAYKRINEMVAREIRLLCEASEANQVGENVVDAGDVLNTLCGMNKVSAMFEQDAGAWLTVKPRESGGYPAELALIGHASEPAAPPSLFGFKKKEPKTGRAYRLLFLAKNAATNSSIDADLSSASQALTLFIGPRSEIDPQGVGAVRTWLTNIVSGETRVGDYPTKGRHVEVIVVFGGLGNVPRVKEILSKAKKVTEEKPHIYEKKEVTIKELIMEGKDIEPLIS